jgi:hypothetical protein
MKKPEFVTSLKATLSLFCVLVVALLIKDVLLPSSPVPLQNAFYFAGLVLLCIVGGRLLASLIIKMTGLSNMSKGAARGIWIIGTVSLFCLYLCLY